MNTTTKRRLFTMLTAVSVGVAQMAAIGVFSQPAYANNPVAHDTITVIGTYPDDIDTVPIPPYDVDPIDPGDGNSGGGGTGNPNDIIGVSTDPTKDVKPCVASRIEDFAGIDKYGKVPVSVDWAFKNIKVKTTSVDVLFAKAAYERDNPNGKPWSMLSDIEKKYYCSVPMICWYSTDVAVIFLPEINGMPQLLSEGIFQYWLAINPNFNPQGVGSYGYTYKGLLHLLGLKELAENFTEEQAREFIICHEMAHAVDPSRNHSNYRLTDSLFDSNGMPLTTDGVALMLLVGKWSNRGDGEYNNLLPWWASRLGIQSVESAKTTNNGC